MQRRQGTRFAWLVLLGALAVPMALGQGTGSIDEQIRRREQEKETLTRRLMELDRELAVLRTAQPTQQAPRAASHTGGGVTAEVVRECYGCVLRSRPMMKYHDCKFEFRITNHTDKLLAWDEFHWEHTTREGKIDRRGLSTRTGNRLGPGKSETFKLWCQAPAGASGYWRAWGFKGRVHGTQDYRFDWDWEVRGECPCEGP